MSDVWDFYFCVVDGKPCSTVLDLGIEDEVPIADHPHLISLRVPLESPRPDGLTSNAEADVLGVLEDALTPAIEELCGALFVGRITWNGARDLFYYARDPAPLKEALDEVFSSVAPRRVMTRVTEDPAWEHYTNVLTPRDEERRWMNDRRVVELLTQEGDRVEVPRPIDHTVVFDDESRAHAFAERVGSEGFATTIERGESGAFVVELVRADPAALAHVHALAERLRALATEHGGEYDGWAAELAKPD